MANCAFGWPLYELETALYTPAFSGGDWEADLPLSNLADRRLAKVARSSDTELASTRLHLDLGVARSVGVLAIPKHTLSKTGAYVRAMAQVSTLLFDYEAGDDITVKGGTFVNATANRTYVDRNGIVRYAAANVIRDAHFESGVRTVLLELSRTNICLQSQTFATTWAVTLATIGSNAAVAPDGTTTADSLIEDATVASAHLVSQSGLTITSNATVAFSCYVKAAGRTFVRIRLVDSTFTDAFSAYFNLSTGAAGTTVNSGAGVLATTHITAVGSSGWYRITITGAINNARTSLHAQIVAAEADNDQTFDGTSTAALYLWGAQLEDSASFATSYIATTTVAVTRAADALSFSYTSVPQNLTVDVKAYHREAATFGGSFLYAIGTAAGVRLTCHKTSAGTTLTGTHNSAAGTVTSTASTVVAFNDIIEARTDLGSTGTIIQASSVNAAAETVGATSAANTLDAAWAATTLYLNSDATPANQGSNAFAYIRIAASTNSLATMQATVYDSGWTDAWPSGLDAEEADGINIPWLLIPSATQTARYWTLQIDDYSNTDGYVDLARLVVAGLYQPDINMLTGATQGLETDTERKDTDGGASIYQAKAVRRTWDFELDHIAEAEALTETWQMQRRLGTHGQLFVVFDTTDTTYFYERSFLATLERLGGLQYPYSIARNKSVFRVREEL